MCRDLWDHLNDDQNVVLLFHICMISSRKIKASCYHIMCWRLLPTKIQSLLMRFTDDFIITYLNMFIHTRHNIISLSITMSNSTPTKMFNTQTNLAKQTLPATYNFNKCIFKTFCKAIFFNQSRNNTYHSVKIHNLDHIHQIWWWKLFWNL